MLIGSNCELDNFFDVNVSMFMPTIIVFFIGCALFHGASNILFEYAFFHPIESHVIAKRNRKPAYGKRGQITDEQIFGFKQELQNPSQELLVWEIPFNARCLKESVNTVLLICSKNYKE